MNKRTLFFWFLFFPGFAISQDLPAIEDSISRAHAKLAAAKDDASRQAASEKMKIFLAEAFTYDGVFDYPFKALQFSTIRSADGRVRLFNWNEPSDDGSSRYYCYVLEWNRKKELLSVTELLENRNQVDKPEQRTLSEDKWMGALYYDIIPLEKSKNNDTYTLLGWQSHDNLTTRKVVDAISVKNGRVRLGAPIFEIDGYNRKRVIYEFSNDVSMSLRYNGKHKHLVFDHLSPRNPMMTGIYADYGPDGSYDRFVLQKGKWIFEENIDVSIYATDSDQPYTDPRK